jgi:hypothetical protein
MWSSSGEYKANKWSIELQDAFTSHMGPYLQLFMLDGSISMGKIYI